MKLGFVSAILGDQPFEEVLRIAADLGYQVVEPMCWPVGKSDRRYAGVTHLDVADFTAAQADDVRALLDKHRVGLSGLGYYPNPLAQDAEHRQQVARHLRAVMDAAALLGLKVVNTFVGRDPARSVEDNWPGFRQVWPALLQHAEGRGLTLAIEHCPMLFSANEWPGGKNLAVSPAVWRRMFQEAPSPAWGINLDPSHFVWQFIDPVPVIREFAAKIVHVHAKDARLDRDRLQEVGVLGLDWHTPKLPGLGDVAWGPFFGALTDAGYQGPVCVEVEDRAFEKALPDRIRALRLSQRYLSQFVG